MSLARVTNSALPFLGLKHVSLLVTHDTASASESVINSLRGVDVKVDLIGNTTRGKPYGFVPQDNCSYTYFTIQFKGVNDKGFGDYADGGDSHGGGASISTASSSPTTTRK